MFTVDNAGFQLELSEAHHLADVHVTRDEGNDKPNYPAKIEYPHSAITQIDYSHDPSAGLDAAERG